MEMSWGRRSGGEVKRVKGQYYLQGAARAHLDPGRTREKGAWLVRRKLKGGEATWLTQTGGWGTPGKTPDNNIGVLRASFGL